MGVGVGFIALAGVAAEFGVVMLVYLDNALRDRERTEKAGLQAVDQGIFSIPDASQNQGP
ncbi:MAG: hypothetical protein ABFR65_04175 [Pseudomonadota bacterium]